MTTFFKTAKCFLMAFVLFFILSFFAAVLICKGGLCEKNGLICMIGVLTAATVFLGFLLGRIVGKRGLFVAVAASGMFLLMVMTVFFLAFEQVPSIESLKPYYIVPVIFGGIGGIVGVNVKK